MAAKSSARLHVLTTRGVQTARDGDHADGGGLQLRVRGESASWVLRFTAPSGKRREMGLGVADRGNVAQAGRSLTGARDAAHAARELLRRSIDPLDDRGRQRQAARAADQARKAEANRERWTLARCARDYHARVIENKKTVRHAASWIASLEQHVPASLWHSHIDDIEPHVLLDALVAAEPHERARRPGDLSETLRRVRQRLDKVCIDAQFYKRCATNPANAVKEKLTEALPEADVQHLRALPYAELPALMSRVRAMQGTAARCLEFAVLTASRTAEVLFLKWDEVDSEAGVWVVPAERMKAGRCLCPILAEVGPHRGASRGRLAETQRNAAGDA